MIKAVAVASVLVVVAVAGCGTAQVNERGELESVPTATGSPTPDSTPSPTPPTVTSSATCKRGADPVGVTSTPVEATLGHRLILLTVENCTADPIRLDGPPTFAVQGKNGRPVATRFTPEDASTTATLDPHAKVYVELDWVPIRGAFAPDDNRLSVRIAGTDAVLTGPLELDRETEVSVGAWDPSPEGWVVNPSTSG